ncbi:hypothetical protein RADP37_05542 [Roseomonas mucosa]|uniref:Uncharacterized protein n=1 Tax=Roseomonas mucosa TaxID=207340 RepID=A0A4Y1MUR1_9PROT|nr:hypothetical protein RADP37_05542 [Roseomonas mucosa]
MSLGARLRLAPNPHSARTLRVLDLPFVGACLWPDRAGEPCSPADCRYRQRGQGVFPLPGRSPAHPPAPRDRAECRPCQPEPTKGGVWGDTIPPAVGAPGAGGASPGGRHKSDAPHPGGFTGPSWMDEA